MDSELSEHFSWAEALRTSVKGVSNMPTPDERVVIRRTAVKMEMIRAILGHRSIHINSWFRSPGVNKAVGGSATSSHKTGEAVDFTCVKFGTALDIAKELTHWTGFLKIDQIILYKGRVHVGFGNKARGQVLTKARDGTYPIGLHPELL